MDEYESMRQLFSAYFHQDWMCDAENKEEVVKSFIDDVGMDKAAAAAQEIETFLNSRAGQHLDELATIRYLGCEYLPSVDGLSMEEWLTEIASLLRK